MQFDFFALSTTLIDTAKLQLLPDTVSTYVHLCLFMSIYVHLLFLKCCNSVCVWLRFASSELWNYGTTEAMPDNGGRLTVKLGLMFKG